MIVGVPREIKQDEYRVALLPVGADELTRAGHRVLVERGAGLGSGIPDEMYRENGAVILGGGVVGKNAAQIAAGFQADVNILDINVDRLRYLEDIMPANVNTIYSDRHSIREQLARADLLIGAVLIEGARAPMLVSQRD